MVNLKDVFFIPFRLNLSYESISYIFLYALLFCINPTLSFLVSIVTLFGNSNPTQRQYYTFYIALACWIGVLNMSKQLFSDQIYYASIYVHVNTSDIFNAIWKYRGTDFLSYKEIVFNIYSVFCNILTGANPRAYFFIITVNIYILHFFAIHKVLSASGRSKQEILCAVVLMAFFTPFFIQSIHAVRQILATSFIVYAIAYRAVEEKNNWPFLIIAFFIHNTTIFFILLAIMPYLYKNLTKKQIFTLLLLFGLFIVFYVQVGALLSVMNIGAISSVGQRLISTGIHGESELFSLRSLFIYAIPTIVASFFILKREYNNDGQTPIICFAYLSILTFILILGFSGAPTVQYRYSFYLYSFIPFILLFPGKSGNELQRIFCYVVTTFFVFRFFMIDVDWDKFADWSEILTNTFFHFWDTVYYIV